ncbi:hypothetical protein [uncultured Methanobrevibacter sp.]|uniref:hypothetical protein n=1 Tax=uncultured Methanobrevibacter sp. TaxID=253161 RepID=UPI0026397428|nr:hypothetical protein [uncultured Methanobrevibacter sp.]
MDNEEVFDNELVDKFDAEDTIFNNCMVDFSEFPKYITHYDDIKGPYSTKYMSPAFKNLNLDTVFERTNKNLVDIEHHSQLNSNLLRRDFNYMTTVHEATKRILDPFIFNTGEVPKETVDYANQTSFYNPKFFNTVEELGMANLNNLRYKVSHKDELNQSDALDLIWLMKSGIDMNREDLLLELTVDIWAKAVAPKWMLDSIRKNLLIWAKKYLVNKEKIKIFKKAIKMAKIEIKTFEEQMRIAGIAGELERAEERGIEKGREEARDTEKFFITKLLEKNTPEEISEEYGISLERILKIKNDNNQQ